MNRDMVDLTQIQHAHRVYLQCVLVALLTPPPRFRASALYLFSQRFYQSEGECVSRNRH